MLCCPCCCRRVLTLRCFAGKLNRADAPSRAAVFCGTRLRRDLFPLLWGNPCGVLTCDAFSSLATAIVPPFWGDLPVPRRFLPYYAIGPDPHCAGIDCFAQDVTGEFCFVNPPFRLTKAAVIFFVESKARGLFVLPDRSGEWWWESYVSGGGFCQWSLRLPLANTEYRVDSGTGWNDVDKPVALTAYVLDFRHIT
jgi:hypothetical protein